MLHLTDLPCDGGSDARYRDNLAAIQLLKELERSGVAPADLTDAQRTTLLRFTAFGESTLIARLFARDANLITRAEADALRAASLTAFYTPIPIVRAVWDALTPALQALPGALRVLEPSCGTGLFFAGMPPALRARAALTGVERDLVSARIARYAHPDATMLAVAFEDAPLADGSFDLVIGNVPFGAIPVADAALHRSAPALTRTVHDYFLARSIQLVRPGGVVAILTSYGTLDKHTPTVRAWVAQRADLVQAVRLPQGFASDIGGTQSGADVLVFQRRADLRTTDTLPPWVSTRRVFLPVEPAQGRFTSGSRLDGVVVVGGTAAHTMASVFAEDASAIVGRQVIAESASGDYWEAVLPPTDTPVAEGLRTRLARMTLTIPTHVTARTPAAKPVSPRLHVLLALYAAAKAVLAQDLAGQDATHARTQLRAQYAALVAEYGVIGAPINLQPLGTSPEGLFLRALETDVQQRDGRWRATPSPFFARASITPPPIPVPGTLSVVDALLVVLNEQGGRVDLDRIGELVGCDPSAALQALAGRVFIDPEQQQPVLADAYLSGNVRHKLAAAERAARDDLAFVPNVSALRAVQPTPLEPHEIVARLGAPWIPVDIIVAFARVLVPELRFMPGGSSIRYDPPLAQWTVESGGYGTHSVESINRWGTPRMPAMELLQHALTGTLPRVSRAQEDGTLVLDERATLAALSKLDEIKTRFASWIWEEPDRAARGAAIYNAQFNAYRQRLDDGSHLTFPGMNTTILRGGALAPHQRDAVWKIMQQQTTLLDLWVGAGKTYTCVAAAVELKRTGRAQKPLVVVPNHLVEQWAAEALRLYPHMRVLAMSASDFTRARRGTFLSRVALEEWDLVVCAHTSFGFIDPGTCAGEFIRTEIAEMRAYLDQQEVRGSRNAKRASKKIEARIQAATGMLHQRAGAITHDDARVLTWDELGIDALFVDEAQEFKNLPVATMMNGLAGIPTGESQRAFDMRIKTWDLIRRGGRVVFATGTPIMNTLGECFIMLKYLADDLLRAQGIHQFDAWARTFADTLTTLEMTADGGGYRMKTRLAKFTNLPEMFQLWFQAVFSRDRNAVKQPVPELMGGKSQVVAVPASPRLTALVRSFVQRIEAIKARQVNPHEDNTLAVVTDGRKAALDVRFLCGGPPDPVNKIGALVAHVAEIYTRYDESRATQLIYCELGTPAGRAATEPRCAVRVRNDADDADEADEVDDDTSAEVQTARNFVYHDIRARLVAQGIPAHEIAFIQEHATKTKRAALYAAVNRGDVRVLIASKQSTGMNIQRRLIALHHLDAPWRPGDVEQRDGRMLRQGNVWPEVMAFHYVTEGSFDVYIWQLLESKATFIAQVRAGCVTRRVIDDVGEIVLSAAEIKAIASGNPGVMRKVRLDADIYRLETQRRSDADGRMLMRRKLQTLTGERAELTRRDTWLTEVQAFLETQPRGDDATAFVASVVAGVLDTTPQRHTTRAAAGAAVIKVVNEHLATAKMGDPSYDATIGAYRGLLLRVHVSPALGAAGVSLVREHDGRLTPISDAGISCQTDLGVFQSADAQLNGITRRREAIPGRLAAIIVEEIAVQLDLDTPWPHSETLAAYQRELVAIETTLRVDTPTDVAAPADAAPEAALVTRGRCPAPVFRADDDVLWAETAAMRMPRVVLPEPANPAAMTEAARILASDSAPDLDNDAHIDTPAVLLPAGIPVSVTYGAVVTPAPAPIVAAPSTGVPQQVSLFSLPDAPATTAPAPAPVPARKAKVEQLSLFGD